MKYLYIAFGVVWTILIAYILNLIRLKRQISSELEMMKKLE